MKSLSAYWSQVGERLSFLTTSQRVAVMLSVALVAGSLLWLVQWSGQPELIRLLDQPLNASETQAIINSLGSDYKLINGDIYVDRGRRHELLMKVTSSGALPEDTSIGFQQLIEDDSPFRPESVNQTRFMVALSNELAAVMKASPMIRDARVFLNTSQARRIGGASTLPKASVYVHMEKGRALDQQIATGLSALVSGAVANLSPDRVEVVDADTGRVVSSPSEESAQAYELLNERRNVETHIRHEISRALSYIPGVLIAVSAELESSTRKRVVTTWDAPSTKRELSDANSRSGSSNSGEAGVSPNVGTSIDGAGRSESSTSELEEVEYYEPRVAEVLEQQERPFTPRRITASVNIPASFLRSVVRVALPEEADIKMETLTAQFEVEAKRIEATVRKIIQSEEDTDIHVDWFFDEAAAALNPELGGVLGEEAVQAGTVTSFVTEHFKDLGLAGLSLMAMGIMFLSMRSSAKSARTAAAGVASFAESPIEEEDDLSFLSEQVGEVGPSSSFLVGHEVDPDELKFNEISGQVTEMIKEDPETAAMLLKQWLSEDD